MTDTHTKIAYGLTPDQWHRLINTAYRNLPDNTTLTPWDIDNILTWCLPVYNAMRRGDIT
jgi:hypothetical protein